MDRESCFDTEEINKMQTFVNEYQYAMDELEGTIVQISKMVKDQSLRGTLFSIIDYLVDNEGDRYNKYNDLLKEFENFIPEDYYDNTGIWEEHQKEIMGGLK